VDLLMKLGCSITQIAAMNATSRATATKLVVRPEREVISPFKAHPRVEERTTRREKRLNAGWIDIRRHFSELDGWCWPEVQERTLSISQIA
jgi:hypothetical protein